MSSIHTTSTAASRVPPTAGLPRVLSILGRVIPVVLVANLVVFGLATLAGVDFRIQTPAATEPETVSWVPVIFMSVIPLLLAGLALTVTRRWAPTSWKVWAWAGLAIGVISLPVFAEATVDTKLALSGLHLITAITWFTVVQRAVRRPR